MPWPKNLTEKRITSISSIYLFVCKKLSALCTIHATVCDDLNNLNSTSIHFFTLFLKLLQDERLFLTKTRNSEIKKREQIKKSPVIYHSNAYKVEHIQPDKQTREFFWHLSTIYLHNLRRNSLTHNSITNHYHQKCSSSSFFCSHHKQDLIKQCLRFQTF